jgi:acyl dehydratase
MIDRNVIGRSLPPRMAHVERGLLALYLESIGETNPLYVDEEIATSRGYPSLLTPPAYVFCLKVGVIHPLEFLRLLGVKVDLGRIFHGEQSFKYFSPVCVGDDITFLERITEVYDKKHGLLTFIATETTAINQEETKVAEMQFKVVITNDGITNE